MSLSTHYLKHESGFILIREWQQGTPIKGVIHLFHGMMEYTGIYHFWSEALSKTGWVVIAHDQPGSGMTVELDCGPDCLPMNGKEKLEACALKVDHWIRTKYPDLPIVRYGHSMGAFVVLNLTHNNAPAGTILTGLKFDRKFNLLLLRAFLYFCCKVLGEQRRATFAHKITFAPLNRSISKKASSFDWVSRNTKLLTKYLRDPFCGNIVSWGYFYTLTTLLLNMHEAHRYKSVTHSLIITGENDPLSKGGSKLTKLTTKLNQGKGVNHTIIPEAFHKVEHDPNEHVVLDHIKEYLAKI